MSTPEEEVRRPYNVGALKLPFEDRDVAHAVITPEDDREFFDIIGADTGDRDEVFPVGAPVTYRVELTDAEAEVFRAASNCRYVELDVIATAFPSSGFVVPSATAQKFMGSGFPRNDLWHGRDVPVAMLDGGTTAAVRAAIGCTLVARAVFSVDEPGVDEITTSHGCLVAPCLVPTGGLLLDAIVFSNAGTAPASAFAAGARWAADNGAQVINYSAGGPSGSSAYVDMIVYLADRGVQLYVSAGNDNANTLAFPSNYSTTYANVHSSISFDEDTGARSTFSNYSVDGSGCAPGTDVVGLAADGSPLLWSGTSASSPHMAQLCARGATGGRYTVAQVAAALDANGRNTGQPAAEQGKGAYDLQAALTALGGFSAGSARTNLSVNPAVATVATGWVGAGGSSGGATRSLTQSRRAFNITVSGSTLEVEYWANASIESGDTTVKRVVFVVHGTDRNADDYAGWAQDAATLAGAKPESETLVVGPRFVADTDITSSQNSLMYWSEQGWKDGNLSQSDTFSRPFRMSSYEVLDRMLTKVKATFSNLTDIVVVGHSAGAQFINRYAAGTTTPETLAGITTRFVIANPSSYLYFDARRPKSGSFANLTSSEIASCPDYNTYKYGLGAGLNAYMAASTNSQLATRYQTRKVWYLLGDKDVTSAHSMDTTCPANWQGPYRYHRGNNYFAYLAVFYGSAPASHTKLVVPNVDHDGQAMLSSAQGREAVYGASTSTAAGRVTGLTGFPRATGFTAPANILTAKGAVTAGQSYALSLGLRCSMTATVNASIRWFTSAGVLISTTNADDLEVTAGAPVRVGRVGTAPSTATTAALYLTTTAGTLTATASLIEAGTVIRTYFDGASTNGAWTGSGGNSTSTRSFPIPAQTYRVNLNTNPSIETASTGYTLGAVRSGITASAVGRSTSVPTPFGTGYAFINVTGDGSTSSTVADVECLLPNCPVTAGYNYTFSVHSRHAAAGTALEWVVRWENDAAANLGTISGGRKALLNAGFVRYWITGTAPAGATRAVLKLLLSGATVTTVQAWRFDGFQYERAITVGEYFDGATSGATWSGTANASTSSVGTSTEPPPGEGSPVTSPGQAHNIGKAGGKNHFNLGEGTASAMVDRTENQLEAGYTSDQYKLNADKTEVIFSVALDAATTSGSSYPRTEYRELNVGGTGDSDTPKTGWDGSSGEHYLGPIGFRVMKLPPNKPEVVVGQIHSASDDVTKLKWVGRTAGSCKLVVSYGNTDEYATVASGLSLGTALYYKVRMINGALEWYLSTNPADMGATKARVADATLLQAAGMYFKFGLYAQTNASKDNPSDGPVIVHILNTPTPVCWHTGYAAPTPVGGTVTKPTVDAGDDATVTVGATFARTAIETANGAVISARSWKISSGPGASSTPIDSDTGLSWTPTAQGTYVLRYSATNSAGTGVDDVTVTVVSADTVIDDPPTGSGPTVYPLQYPDSTPYPVIGAGSTVVNVSTAAALTSALSAASPGQKIVLANGTYSGDFTIANKTGSASNGISVEAATTGGASFASGSTFTIKDCQHVTVKGLTFPFDAAGDTLQMRGACKWVRYTRCTVGPTTHAESADVSNAFYVGDDCSFFRIDHCEVRNKGTSGNGIRVYGNFTSYKGCTYGRIDHNIFRSIKPEVGNDKEPIRYGVSTMSRTVANAVIERNYFADCLCEPELTSVKMGRIRVSGNTYYRCAGGPVVRHGTDSILSDNYVVDGNNTFATTIGSGGFRFYDSGHDILHNYIFGTIGEKFQAALMLDTGDAEGSSTNLSAHWRVINATVDRNVLINCNTAICVGDNYSLAPSGCDITNNITAGITTGTPPITYINGTALVGSSTVTGNLNYATPAAGGFTQDADGIWRKTGYGPRMTYIKQADVGPTGDVNDTDGTGTGGTDGGIGTTPPTVNAGGDVTVLAGTQFARTAVENGASITTRSWSIQAGPTGQGTVLSSTASVVWSPTVVGTYVLRYTATNSAGTGSDDITVTVTTGGGGGPVTAPEFVAVSPGNSGASGFMEIPAPPGAQAGDFQIAVIASAGSETVTSVPAGWQLLDTTTVTSAAGDPGGPATAWIYYTGTAATGPATWVKSGTRVWHGVRAAWRGQSALGQHAVVGETTPAGAVAHDTPPVTPSRANSLVVGVVCTDLVNGIAGPFAPPGGWTERYDATKTSSTENESITIGDVVAGAVSTSGTFTGTNADEAAVFAFVLEGPIADQAVIGSGIPSRRGFGQGTVGQAGPAPTITGVGIPSRRGMGQGTVTRAVGPLTIQGRGIPPR